MAVDQIATSNGCAGARGRRARARSSGTKPLSSIPQLPHCAPLSLNVDEEEGPKEDDLNWDVYNSGASAFDRNKLKPQLGLEELF